MIAFCVHSLLLHLFGGNLGLTICSHGEEYFPKGLSYNSLGCMFPSGFYTTYYFATQYPTGKISTIDL